MSDAAGTTERVKVSAETGDGILYVAVGPEFLAMALRSAQSLRATNPELGIALVTNVGPRQGTAFAWTTGLIDHWEHVTHDQVENRSLKLQMYARSPFTRTLFLDADTIVLGELGPMFGWLDRHDVALHLQQRGPRAGWATVALEHGRTVGDLLHWNGGVVLFRRSEAAARFFARWQDAFHRLGHPVDQLALAETVMASDAHVLAFDAHWNSPVSTMQKFDWTSIGGIRILHYMHRIPSDTLNECLAILDRLHDDLPGASAAERAALRDRMIARAQPSGSEPGRAARRPWSRRALDRSGRTVCR